MTKTDDEVQKRMWYQAFSQQPLKALIMHIALLSFQAHQAGQKLST